MITVIVDCHAICHTVKHTIGDLSYEEQKVGIIFGFLRQLLSYSKRFDTHRFIFAWDSKKSKRRAIYPPYKNRPPIPEKDQQFEQVAFQQFYELRLRTLPKFGFKNSFIQTGLEADDIIAKITLTFPNTFVIVSGDNDLYQLLSPQVSLFNHKTKRLTTDQSFMEEYSITPQEWVMVKQIAGCRSDTVKGIDGIGEKRAIAYILDTLKQDSQWFQKIREGTEIIQRNEALVKLPFEGTQTPDMTDHETFLLANFIELTDWYGFRSFRQLDTLNEWIEQFGMQ